MSDGVPASENIIPDVNSSGVGGSSRCAAFLVGGIKMVFFSWGKKDEPQLSAFELYQQESLRMMEQMNEAVLRMLAINQNAVETFGKTGVDNARLEDQLVRSNQLLHENLKFMQGHMKSMTEYMKDVDERLARIEETTNDAYRAANLAAMG